jgi:hypothetical protein
MYRKKYEVTLTKTYIVSAHTEQEAKEQSMIVWEAKSHPVNIAVKVKENKGKKKKEAK